MVSCLVMLQSRITERALELLALPNDGVPKLLLDIGNAFTLFLLKRCVDLIKKSCFLYNYFASFVLCFELQGAVLDLVARH